MVEITPRDFPKFPVELTAPGLSVAGGGEHRQIIGLRNRLGIPFFRERQPPFLQRLAQPLGRSPRRQKARLRETERPPAEIVYFTHRPNTSMSPTG